MLHEFNMTICLWHNFNFAVIYFKIEYSTYLKLIHNFCTMDAHNKTKTKNYVKNKA